MLLKVFLILIIIFIIFLVICYNVFRIIMISSKVNGKSRERINMIERSVKEKIIQSGAEKWIKNIEKEDIFIMSYDKLKLHGCKIVNKVKSKKWVIMLHGYFSNLYQLSHCAQKFYENGYNILLLDSRACGKSAGKYTGMGYNDSEDLKKWIDYLNDNVNKAEITLYGLSTGAVSVIFTCSTKTKLSVEKIIIDSAYSSAEDLLKLQLNIIFKIPKIMCVVIIKVVNIFSKVFVGYSLSDIKTYDTIKNIEIPTLLIHCTDDTFAPYNMAKLLFENMSCEKKMLSIQNADHCEGCWINEQVYWETVFNFLNSNIKKY